MELDPEKFIALFHTTLSSERTKHIYILEELIKPMLDEQKKETTQKINEIKQDQTMPSIVDHHV